jgi:hypothetical protein
MVTAATLTHMGMTDIYDAMPHYHSYYKRHAANADETTYRLALGLQLEGMGQRLLDGAETRPHLLSRDQHEIIDLMTDDMTTILKVLNRTGVIHLADEPEVSIPYLKALDRQLLMLLEHMWKRTSTMFDADADAFKIAAGDIAACLAHFLEVTEERNSQLGLGWESEFNELDVDLDHREEDF